MVQPLHLVELAAQHLREASANAPESVLLPDKTAEASPTAAAIIPAEPRARRSGIRLEVETLKGAGMITSQGPRDRIAEEFRIIAQQIAAGADAPDSATAERTERSLVAERNLVMVTSSVPGEGKSFTALNLAANLALGSKRSVVLVDADTGPNSVSKTLGLEAESGLLDLAGAPARENEIPWVRSRIDALSVLPIGGGTDAAGRALIAAHYPIASVISAFVRRFADTLFIVDAPPCLSSSDPAAIAAVANQVLLVVEAEKTRRPQIEAALDMIDACQNIKLMLNKVRMKTSETFGLYS